MSSFTAFLVACLIFTAFCFNSAIANDEGTVTITKQILKEISKDKTYGRICATVMNKNNFTPGSSISKPFRTVSNVFLQLARDEANSIVTRSDNLYRGIQHVQGEVERAERYVTCMRRFSMVIQKIDHVRIHTLDGGNRVAIWLEIEEAIKIAEEAHLKDSDSWNLRSECGTAIAYLRCVISVAENLPQPDLA